MAGTNTEVTTQSGSVSGSVDGIIYTFSYTATADAAAATFVDRLLPSNNVTGGTIVAIKAKYGATAPSALKVDVKDALGIIVATASFTATASVNLTIPASFTGPLTIALSTNATNSAIVTVALVVK